MGGHSLRLTGWQENLGAGYSSPAQYWPDLALCAGLENSGAHRAHAQWAVSKLRQSVAYTGETTLGSSLASHTPLTLGLSLTAEHHS